MTSMMVAARARLSAPARLASFRYLWTGQTISQLGDGLSTVAFAWITLSVTRSTLTLGYVLALQAVPRALLTLVGGSLSDRFSARQLMVLSSWARTVVMIAVAAIGLDHLLNVWMLLVAAAAFGAVDAFFMPARSAILPSVVDSELMEPANALMSLGSRVSSVLGPAVGGILIAVFNADYAFLVDGIGFAVCALCVSRVTLLPKTPDEQETPDGADGDAGETAAVPEDSLLSRIKAGLRYAFSDSRIRTMVAIDTVITFCYAGPFSVGFVSLAKFHLSGGSSSLGALNGAIAAGAILGGLVGGAVTRRLRVGLLIAGLAGWMAVGMALLAVTHSPVMAVATALGMGFGVGFEGVFGLSWIQRNIEGSVLSRVIAIDMVCGYAVAPISLVACGGLAQTRLTAMFLMTAVILAITALATLASRPTREMV